MRIRKCHRIFLFSTAVILKIKSRSLKSNQFFAMSQLFKHANLVRIQPLVQKILCGQESVTEFSFFSTAVALNIKSSKKCHRIFLFSTAVTLKIKSRSLISNQFFAMSQLYKHTNLIRIQPLVHKIFCRQDSVTPTPMPTQKGSAPKQYTPRLICVCVWGWGGGE